MCDCVWYLSISTPFLFLFISVYLSFNDCPPSAHLETFGHGVLLSQLLFIVAIIQWLIQFLIDNIVQITHIMFHCILVVVVVSIIVHLAIIIVIIIVDVVVVVMDELCFQDRKSVV